MKLLEGKVAVITGAGSGMGKAAVEVFAREGARVVAADISGAEKDVAAAVGANVLAVSCDVSHEAEVERAIRLAVEKFGGVDAVLNVAGIVHAAMLADITMEDYEKLMRVDQRGVFLGTKHAVKIMIETGKAGSIVNWSSVGGFNAAPFTSLYSAAKAAVISFTKSAAVEYGANGIHVNCLCPGFILNTMMTKGAEQMMPELPLKASLNRGGTAQEVAEVAAFLVSDRASYVTGAIIPVDGGWSAKLF